MTALEAENQIMKHAVNGMPFHKSYTNRDYVDKRKTYIRILYDYLATVIDDNNMYEETIRDVTYNYINFAHPFELNLNTIYSIHINIINRLFNKYLFKKYNITEDYGINVEKTFLSFVTNSLIKFELSLKLEPFYNKEYYDLDLVSNLELLIPDKMKLSKITSEEILQLSELQFHELREEYIAFYIKYNKLVEDIKAEIDKLNKSCCLNLTV